VPRLRQVGPTVRDFAFPFVADHDVGILCRLDRLYVAIADTAHTQRQTVPPQFLLVTIEIDRHLRRPLGRRFQSSDKREFPELRQRRSGKLKLELDF
jgi:hypothetical protein